MAGLGLYDAFKDYIQQQLKVRRAILSSPRSLNVEEETTESESNVTTRYAFDSSNDFQTTNRLGPEQFFAYTTEKRCTIRMASGVDIEESAKNGFLRDYEEYQIGQGLAARFVLEGGVKSTTFNNWTRKELSEAEIEKQVEENLANNPKKAGSGGIAFEQDIAKVTIEEIAETNGQNINLRGGFGSGGAYGDRIMRSDANDGYGIVPMPGIKSAKINTVSKEGALREATVDFSCHNRAQLEVLEALYMRPGYIVLLEWGWDPYINNGGGIENNEFTSLDLFFDPSQDFDILSERILKNKRDSGGNYDGFIGYVKNFSYKVREDGGYDCTTELISNNELLESFKAGKRITNLGNKGDVKVEDNFIYYLRSIQKNLQRAGDEYYLSIVNTEKDQLRTEKNGIIGLEDTTGTGKKKYFKPIGVDEDGRTIYVRVEGKNDPTPREEQSGKFYYNVNDEYYEKLDKEDKEDFLAFSEFNPQTTKIKNLNEESSQYLEGFKEIIDLIEKITKEKITNNPETMLDTNSGRGFQAFLNGTLLKQVIQYDGDEEKQISGFESQIYVRWDLLTQIMNHLVIDQYKTNKPLAEFTYLNPNSPTTFDLTNPDNKPEEGSYEPPFYLTYSAPDKIEKADPVKLPVLYNKKGEKIDDNTRFPELEDTDIKDNVDNQFHPLLGNSFDYNVCLLPHMKLFNRMFTNNLLARDYDVSDDKNKLFTRAQGENFDANFVKNLTSFPQTEVKRNSIGLVYFNLEYILNEYINMRLESTKAEDEEGSTYTRFKKDFSMLKYLQTIWGSVNNVTGDYYQFDVTTEHERPHILRVIEKNFNRTFKENEVFEFRPQGLESVTRNFMFNSSITKDIASVISIAAQAPKEEQSLTALSFKAFHKDIKSRFTTLEFTEKKYQEEANALKEELINDIKKHNRIVVNLRNYLIKLGNSDFTSEYADEKETKKVKIISPKTAIMHAQELEELRIEILNRFPLTRGPRKNPHPKAGQWRPNTTHHRSEVIPLEISLQLDGISGLIPYNVFKIHEDKLPYDYGRGDIAFIVKNESQSITAEGDWVTQITGQLVLLNVNPNNEGENIIDEETSGKNNYLDPIDASETKCTTAYGFGFTPAPNGDPEWDGKNITADKTSLKDTIEALEDLGYNKNAVIGTFAVLWAEASKYKTNGKNAGFRSAGAHNYAGIQTDNAVWTGTTKDGSKGPIKAQYCRKDAERYRAFALFEDVDQFLKFAAFQHKRKGLHASSADVWTEKYINNWWSPKEKTQATHKKGGTVYKSKKAIYNTAVKAYNAIKAGSETYPK